MSKDEDPFEDLCVCKKVFDHIARNDKVKILVVDDVAFNIFGL
jgi:hypothetical protein